MLPTKLITTLLVTLPSIFSAPVTVPGHDYNCGYVLTKPDENVHAGLSAFDTCNPFFYNSTIGNFQDAYAYKLIGGCSCGFYA